MAFLKLAYLAAFVFFCGSYVEVEGNVKSLGCWKDTMTRAIPTLEKKDKRLDGYYTKRKDAINKCMKAALARGYNVFAVQNGGWCASSATALSTMKKYGPSKACKNGKGGPGANDVYQIIRGYTSLGCWKDTMTRAIPTLEKKDKILDGYYTKRKNAINKCMRAALARGYNVFAVQNGGWCASSATALSTMKKYGASKACKNGKGGPGANDVYLIKYTKMGDEPEEEDEQDEAVEQEEDIVENENENEDEDTIAEEDEPVIEENEDDSTEE